MTSVTRKTHNSRAERRDELRRRLLTAVEQLLNEGDSYTELSVERLVNEAGISRSTFYVYFEDKGDLLRALMEDVIGQIVASAQQWWDLPPDATRADVHDALRHLIDTYRPHRVLMSAVVDASSYDAKVREQFSGIMQIVTAEVTGHIESGRESGFVRSDIDPEPTAAWLTWMAERGLQQLCGPAHGDDLDEISDALTAVVWNTLYAGAGARNPRAVA